MRISKFMCLSHSKRAKILKALMPISTKKQAYCEGKRRNKYDNFMYKERLK